MNNITQNEIDMLKGNIARMCVCDTHKELNSMLYYAIQRLYAIHEQNFMRLEQKNKDRS